MVDFLITTHYLRHDSRLSSRHFLMVKLYIQVKSFVIIQKLEEKYEF